MCKEMYDLLSIILWAITACAAIIAAFVYLGQLCMMNRSLKDQNLAWLIQYLQSRDVREARYVVLETLKDKKEEWGQDEKKQAATACAAYGVAGVLARRRKVDIDILVKNWGWSIIDACKVCNGLIKEMRAGKPGYWTDLLWLEGEAIRSMKR